MNVFLQRLVEQVGFNVTEKIDPGKMKNTVRQLEKNPKLASRLSDIDWKAVHGGQTAFDEPEEVFIEGEPRCYSPQKQCQDMYVIKLDLPDGSQGRDYFIDALKVIVKYKRDRSRDRVELVVSITDREKPRSTAERVGSKSGSFMLKPRQGLHDYEFDILKNINEYKEAYPNSSKFLRIELTKMRTERQRNHHNDRMMNHPLDATDVHFVAVSAEIQYRKRPMTARRRRRNAEDNGCRLREINIRLNEHIGFEHVHRPTTYTLKYCAGKCGTSTIEHAKWIQRDQRHNSDIPDHAKYHACCIPVETEPMEIFFSDTSNKHMVKTIADMRAKTCRCT